MVEDGIWTIQRMLDWMRGYLEDKGDENPRAAAQWLLSDATGLSRIELYARFEQPLSMEERQRLRESVRRRAAGEPLQYITGSAPFRHLVMKVERGVLIPRPETEVLVSEALALLPAARRVRSREFLAEMAPPDVAGAPALGAEAMSELVIEERCTFAATEPEEEPRELLVADIGTGSGCIACSLAFEHPLIRVVATDLSAEALAVAQRNAADNGLSERIAFYEGDLGAAVPAALVGSFDAILSNPPYIPDDVLATMPREVVDFEPDLALAGGIDGLDPFRRLLPWAFEALADHGFFACELHEGCLDEAAALAREGGFARVRVVDDLTGRPRVLIALKTVSSSDERDDIHGL